MKISGYIEGDRSEKPEKYASLLSRVMEEDRARTGKDRVVMLNNEELQG